jgi:hypothetical protein
MRGLQLLRSRSARSYGSFVPLLATLALLIVPAVASAAHGFTEEVAPPPAG